MKSNNNARSISSESAAYGSTADGCSSPSESALSEQEFKEFRSVIRELTGIKMGASKHHLVHRRVQTRLKATGIRSIEEYLKFLKSGNAAEQEAFSNAVTTNLTSFFREQHHFDYLARTIIPEFVAKKGNANKRIRIWSAGCSTGEEPYSIAITLKESLNQLERWDAKLLCTDLDSNVLATCKAGVYSHERVKKISEARLRRWFKKNRAHGGGQVKVSQELQSLITFKQLNLMHDWPMKGRFDIIFCRNVVIYFDKPTQRVLMERYANILEDGGYLILGHSESLFNVSDRFELVGNTIYRKTL